MTYEAFQHLARLYVIGSLEPEEMVRFQEGRCRFGEQAEAFLRQCQRLSVALALSLQPRPPAPGTKQKLLERIRESPAPVAGGKELPLRLEPALWTGRH